MVVYIEYGYRRITTPTAAWLGAHDPRLTRVRPAVLYNIYIYIYAIYKCIYIYRRLQQHYIGAVVYISGDWRHKYSSNSMYRVVRRV